MVHFTHVENFADLCCRKPVDVSQLHHRALACRELFQGLGEGVDRLFSRENGVCGLGRPGGGRCQPVASGAKAVGERRLVVTFEFRHRGGALVSHGSSARQVGENAKQKGLDRGTAFERRERLEEGAPGFLHDLLCGGSRANHRQGDPHEPRVVPFDEFDEGGLVLRQEAFNERGFAPTGGCCAHTGLLTTRFDFCRVTEGASARLSLVP